LLRLTKRRKGRREQSSGKKGGGAKKKLKNHAGKTPSSLNPKERRQRTKKASEEEKKTRKGRGRKKFSCQHLPGKKKGQQRGSKKATRKKGEPRNQENAHKVPERTWKCNVKPRIAQFSENPRRQRRQEKRGALSYRIGVSQGATKKGDNVRKSNQKI